MNVQAWPLLQLGPFIGGILDYFKHYSTASDSKSMNVVFDEMGHRGIAFWWLLIELCSENWDGVSEPKFSFHPRLVSTKLKTRSNLVRTFLELCSNLGMGKFEVSSTKIDIDLPKLREIKESRGRIRGNRQKKIDIYRLDKEEDKEGDKKNLPEKKLSKTQSQDFRNSKDSPLKFTPDHFVDLWNEIMGKRLGYAKGLGGGKHRENFLDSMNYLPTEDQWRGLLEKCVSTPYLMGQNDKGWTVSPTWIVDHDNAIKVLNGDYDDDKAIKNLFAGMQDQEVV